MRHLRNNATYLRPARGRNSLTFVTLVLLGFTINLLLISPIVIAISMIAGLMNLGAACDAKNADVGDGSGGSLIFLCALGFAVWSAFYSIVISLISRLRQVDKTDTQGRWREGLLYLTVAVLCLLGILVFLGIQGPAIGYVHDELVQKDPLGLYNLRVFYSWIIGSISIVSVFAGIVRSTVSKFAPLVARVLSFALALIAPLLIWSSILVLEMPIVCTDLTPQFSKSLNHLTGVPVLGWMQSIRMFIQSAVTNVLIWDFSNWPVLGPAAIVPDVTDVLMLYGLSACLLALIALFANVNSTSLHNYYRDRINSTFISPWLKSTDEPEPWALRKTSTDGVEARQTVRSMRNRPARRILLSDLPKDFPIHIINAALNIPNSASNVRGRDADIFTFSRIACGSPATGYCPTHVMEEADRQLDLATAIAISGAAVAPNQSQGNQALRFLLALINARLGYWLINPATKRKPRRYFPFTLIRQNVSPYFFFRELFGWLDEYQDRVLLSDGAHIEALGAYELFRRKCDYIIIVDAEHDPGGSLRALANLTRLAKIDFGYDVKIDLSDLFLNQSGLSRKHAALGRVIYSSNHSGQILYIKATLTGDENEYIREYRLRSAFFPHETTADQFFTEAQFEAYRALGHHTMTGLVGGAGAGLKEWFSFLEAHLSTHQYDYRAYLEIQRQIFDSTTIWLGAVPDAATNQRVLRQIWIMEDAVIRLGLNAHSGRYGPFRPLIDVFRSWTNDPAFALIWAQKRKEVSSNTLTFVESLASPAIVSPDVV